MPMLFPLFIQIACENIKEAAFPVYIYAGIYSLERMGIAYHTYGSRCILGLARVLSTKPVHLKFAFFTFTMEAI